MRGMMGSDEEGKEVFQYSQSPLYVVTFFLCSKMGITVCKLTCYFLSFFMLSCTKRYKI
jgi:hypothetical protein